MNKRKVGTTYEQKAAEYLTEKEYQDAREAYGLTFRVGMRQEGSRQTDCICGGQIQKERKLWSTSGSRKREKTKKDYLCCLVLSEDAWMWL